MGWFSNGLSLSLEMSLKGIQKWIEKEMEVESGDL